jgi:hypothetical protein
LARVEPAVVNRLELRVIGMSRSGNHAIIDWILGQADGRTCFLNCAEPKHDPFSSARPISEHEECFRANYPEFDLEAEARGELTAKDLLLYSYEDVFLGGLARADVEARHDAQVGRSGRRIDVLILRDPFNLFASRRAAAFAPLAPETWVRIWCQHAREFVGDRRHLRNERVMLSYNRWVADRDYRRDIAGALGLRFDDAPARAVARTGGGSSFDGVRYHGRAHRMPVLERWRAFLDDPDYLALLTPEVLALSERVFGPPPAPLAEALEGDAAAA